jgi:PmbA protein
MIEKIRTALNNERVSMWQILEIRKKSVQSFMALTEREAIRTVDSTVFDVTIYKQKDDGKLGLSSFRVSPGEDRELDKRLGDALFAAELVSNQPFELPSMPETVPNVSIADPAVSEKLLDGFEKRLIAAVAKEKRTRLSAAEFFVDRVHSRLFNSNGLELEQESTLLHTEFILLSKTGKSEKEFINRYTRRFVQDFNLEHEVAESSQFARDATKATLPKTGVYPVLLTDEPLDNLFNPLVAKASARLKYNKMVQASLGDSLSPDIRGDSITLWSNPLLARSVGSYRFDSYGTPGQRVCLIEQGRLKNHLADKRYADYLSVPATGSLGALEVEPGTRSYKSMLNPKEWGSDRIYHLQAFSAFEPNAITGAFSAEIRAGYEITAKGVKPIKGGSVSGVLSEAITDVYLSREQTHRERALLPKGVLFRKLTIAGK